MKVLAPYPKIPLKDKTDIPSHKVLPAKFSLRRAVQVRHRFLLNTPGMGNSEFLTTTRDLSSAGGSGWMQFFFLTEKAYASICAHVGSIPLMFVLPWTLFGSSG